MQRYLVKKLTYFVVIAAWFVLANHCILGDALASVSSHKAHPCHNNSAADPSSSGQSGSPSKNSSHHGKCQNKGCCQPVLHSATDSQSLNQTVAIEALVINTFNFISKADTKYLNTRTLSDATGPPLRSKIYLLGLSLSPNAPPTSTF